MVTEFPLGLPIEAAMHKVKFHEPSQRRTRMLSEEQFQAHTELAYIADLNLKGTDLPHPWGIQYRLQMDLILAVGLNYP